VVDKDGKSTTRIRVGPFETREEADKVAARIRKLDLPVSVFKI
jgi:DedD protein